MGRKHAKLPSEWDRASGSPRYRLRGKGKLESSVFVMGIAGVIRPCAFGFVQEEDRLLLARMRDPDDDSYYFRPLGGGIDFGETGEEALRREFREELGVELAGVRFLGFLENLFEMRQERYHELCLIFLAEPDGWSIERFVDYAIPESAQEDSEETAVVWKLGDIDRASPLYPDGIFDLVRNIEPAG